MGMGTRLPVGLCWVGRAPAALHACRRLCSCAFPVVTFRSYGQQAGRLSVTWPCGTWVLRAHKLVPCTTSKHLTSRCPVPPFPTHAARSLLPTTSLLTQRYEKCFSSTSATCFCPGRRTPAPSNSQERLSLVLDSLVDVPTIMSTLPTAIRNGVAACQA